VKRILAIAALLVALELCSAQQYTVLDLGSLGGSQRYADAINSLGQVAGYTYTLFNAAEHAFRTAANTPITPASDDLGTLGGTFSQAWGINDSGQVTGWSYLAGDSMFHAFRTSATGPINSATDDLGTLGGSTSRAYGIDALGRVVGGAETYSGSIHAFRTAANSPINPGTDDLGTLGGTGSTANAINASGQVVGAADLSPGPNGEYTSHAFRTAANHSIDFITDDLGTLGGANSTALDINDSGQVVGWSFINGSSAYHAFRTAPNSAINPATDDLGTLGGSLSIAYGVNNSGIVVGVAGVAGDSPHAFLYSGGVMYDLNELVPAELGRILLEATAINDAGQIVVVGLQGGLEGSQARLFLLTPNSPYKAFVQPPISTDGSSVLRVSRGVIPIKFTLTKDDALTCNLPAAAITLTRTEGETIGVVAESSYSMAANPGSNFRISGCQYLYNLAAKALGAGAYRVDITISGIVVGTAVFALE